MIMKYVFMIKKNLIKEKKQAGRVGKYLRSMYVVSAYHGN